jgi:endoglucanase
VADDPWETLNVTETSFLLDRRHDERRRDARGNAALSPTGADRRTGVDRRRVAAAALATTMTLGVLPSLAVAGSVNNPVYGAPLYVEPNTRAQQQADLWRKSRPKDARQMDKIATQSQAVWFGNWSGDVKAAVDRKVTAAIAAGKMPVLVAYNIPNRDCGSYSAGGSTDGYAYRQWLQAFAAGIRDRRAIVIVEPDALAMASKCGTVAQQEERYDLLYDAISILKQNPATRVYMDAGHSNWITSGLMSARLDRVGIHRADGFSLNVSNFHPTSAQVTYGTEVSRLLGGVHFVVDTSRNGLGPATGWCNPTGEALGTRPTTLVTNALVDAYLWVKRPGESDGTCNGGPVSGTWWPDYALGLARRAAY